MNFPTRKYLNQISKRISKRKIASVTDVTDGHENVTPYRKTFYE